MWRRRLAGGFGFAQARYKNRWRDAGATKLENFICPARDAIHFLRLTFNALHYTLRV
jgi:hypothetical protein